jgi:uncharacterized protein (TIGR01777 family)
VTPIRIVIPGGSGQIGRFLARHFHDSGHFVTVLARHPAPTRWATIPWDGETHGDWVRAINGADVVINLAGRSVDCRYTQGNRREILESRVCSTRAIGEAIAQASRPPALWMNASTATIYRHALDRPMDESTGEIGGNEPGAPDTWRFSIDVATSWERAFCEAQTPRTRKIALRSAMVMAPSRGGVFDVLLRMVRFGLGGTAGSGEQFVSWIHDADFIRALEFLIAQEELSGAVNLASPNPLPNAEFMRTLRREWGMPVGLPAANWMLEAGAFFLRTETELILKSRRVIPGHLLENGFEFQFPFWDAAAKNLIARMRSKY